jgi:hypothetical protein
VDLTSQSVCAIVVNWNGWRDTVVCIESLLALDESPFRILVCDNASSDDSVSQLRCWLGSRSAQERETVYLLPLPKNLGYAGALNAGIRWAQSHARTQFFWLLNNDVQAMPGALRELLAARHSVPSAGLCGSVLLDWDEPAQVQAIGGRYRKWLGVGWHDKREPVGGDAVCVNMDYPVGASLLVDEVYLACVGPMDESYFLYCEEMDWAERGRRHGFRPVIALRSRLRHKEGASTGSRGGVRHKSMLSEYYGVTNRLRITRRFWPAYLPVVWLSLWLVIADRLVHCEYRRAGLVLRLMFSPRKWLR